MKNKQRALIICLLLVLLLSASFFRIKYINRNNAKYEVNEIYINPSEEKFKIDGVEYSLKGITKIVEAYNDDAEQMYVTTSLAFELKNVSQTEIDLLQEKKVSFFAKYKNFSSAMFARLTNNDHLLQPDQTIEIIVDVELAEGKFYNYYSD